MCDLNALIILIFNYYIRKLNINSKVLLNLVLLKRKSLALLSLTFIFIFVYTILIKFYESIVVDFIKRQRKHT